MVLRHGIKLSKDERVTLLRRPWWKPVAQTAVNVSLYATAAFLVTVDHLWPLRIVLWPLMGLMLAGALAAAHDCFHNSYLDSKLGNRIAGTLWSVLILSNFTALKQAHLVHHRQVGTDDDSEAPFLVNSVTTHVRLLLFSAAALPRAAFRSVRILGGLWCPPYLLNKRERLDARLDSSAILLWLVVACVLTICTPIIMLLTYWVPLAFFPMMAIIIAMPEHHRCGSGPDILSVTRTTKSNWFVRMLIWNSNFHVEHHLYPGVPSCNLPALHRIVHDHLHHSATGYLNFHLGVLRNLTNARITSTPPT